MTDTDWQTRCWRPRLENEPSRSLGAGRKPWCSYGISLVTWSARGPRNFGLLFCKFRYVTFCHATILGGQVLFLTDLALLVYRVCITKPSKGSAFSRFAKACKSFLMWNVGRVLVQIYEPRKASNLVLSLCLELIRTVVSSLQPACLAIEHK